MMFDTRAVRPISERTASACWTRTSKPLRRSSAMMYSRARRLASVPAGRLPMTPASISTCARAAVSEKCEAGFEHAAEASTHAPTVAATRHWRVDAPFLRSASPFRRPAVLTGPSRGSQPTRPPPAWRLRRRGRLENDQATVHEDMPDRHLVVEEIALGHDQVGDLAFLDRPEAITNAGDR